MSLQSIIQSIGNFFAKLFNDTKDAFEALPQEQQNAIIQGVNVAEVIKLGYTKGEDFVINEVATKAGVSPDVAKQVVLYVLKSIGINVDEVQAGLDQFADRAENTVTSEGWNSLYQTLAKAAASWLSTGSLNWLTLSLGVIEIAYQKIFKGVE